jgi:hypothetical protein
MAPWQARQVNVSANAGGERKYSVPARSARNSKTFFMYPPLYESLTGNACAKELSAPFNGLWPTG